jgi:hypothetical protein
LILEAARSRCSSRSRRKAQPVLASRAAPAPHRGCSRQHCQRKCRSLWTQRLQPRLNVLRLVVDRCIESGLIGQPPAFFQPARDAYGAAALNLRDLSHDRTGCARRTGDDDGFAFDWTTHVEQAEIGCDAFMPSALIASSNGAPGQRVELALRGTVTSPFLLLIITTCLTPDSD